MNSAISLVRPVNVLGAAVDPGGGIGMGGMLGTAGAGGLFSWVKGTLLSGNSVSGFSTGMSGSTGVGGRLELRGEESVLVVDVDVAVWSR